MSNFPTYFFKLNKILPHTLEDIAKETSYEELAKAISFDENTLRQWWQEGKPLPLSFEEVEKLVGEIRRFILESNKDELINILKHYKIPPIPYDLKSEPSLERPPLGKAVSPPLIPLIKRPTDIAGFQVDFPLGLPASVLTQNAEWIGYYAHRGFDILTYKTVRTRKTSAHEKPNWAFLIDSPDHIDPSNTEVDAVNEYTGSDKGDRSKLSMANSFGIPSLEPTSWQEDIKKAKEFLREGHQVLIVSIMATIDESESSVTDKEVVLKAIADDFAQAAVMAKKAGADIIEANYSCPNLAESSTENIYQDPNTSSFISKTIKDTLSNSFPDEKVPLFVKIGYLQEPQLCAFVEKNINYIEGIVAINTIPAKVVDPTQERKPLFPNREEAGISGFAIRKQAQEVAKNLVKIREELLTKNPNLKLNILGVGGALTPQDCRDYLDNIKVDVVESCTGAFIDPDLGIKLRSPKQTTQDDIDHYLIVRKLDSLAQPKEVTKILQVENNVKDENEFARALSKAKQELYKKYSPENYTVEFIGTHSLEALPSLGNYQTNLVDVKQAASYLNQR